MARTIVDLDESALAFAQQQLGTTTKRDTINQALKVAAGVSADDRARGLAWLREHADEVLDFELLAAHERAGR